MLDFTRIATISPSLRVGDCAYNVSRMRPLLTKARQAGAHVVLFPELGITGYSCGDLFRQPALLQAAQSEVSGFLAFAADWDGIVVFGCPVAVEGRLFNCALLSQAGRLMGIVPKTHLPGNNEFYEPRWFASAMDAAPQQIRFAGQEVPFGADLLFPVMDHPDLVVGIEICEDLWSPIPPSSLLARAGATVILNPSASNELIGKAE